MIFRRLGPEEEEEFRQFARESDPPYLSALVHLPPCL
jgi:hypothetical protein